MNTWSAAILAGGAGRRLGGIDKSALLVGGLTILERQLAVLRPITDDILLVGGRLARPGARLVRDRVEGCGPMGGLETAMTEARYDTIVVVACDMPYVTAALLAHLASLAPTADAVVPRTDRGYHPLCAAYSRDCLPAVSRRLAARELKMLDLLSTLRTREVSRRELDVFGDVHRLLANVNTPDDRAALNASGGVEP